MNKRIFLAYPRLDCSFKPGHVPDREGPPTHPLRLHLAEFLERLVDYHRQAGDRVTIDKRPLWQFDLEEVREEAARCDVVYFPHKQKAQFDIGDNALFYKLTVFPEYCTVDPNGRGAGLSWLPVTPVADDQAWKTYGKLKQRVAENKSKFEQPDRTKGFDVGAYDLFVCQIPHDEAIMFHSDVGVGEALRTVIAASEHCNKSLIVKGHPANPKSMAPLRALTEASANATWVDNVSIHTCLAGTDTVFLVNSGVGFEAMLHDKPIISFGRSEYSSIVSQVPCDVAALISAQSRRHALGTYVGFLGAFIDNCIEIAEPRSYGRVLARATRAGG